MPLADLVITLCALITFTLGFIVALYFLGQQWVRTISQGATLLLLPCITYVITSVIARDISLALGMVGALSIVRFRNPVRSPLELVAYFGCIGLGICASVSVTWLLLLGSLLIVMVVAIAACRLVARKLFNFDVFTASFSEGSQLATLEVFAKQPIPWLETSKQLTNLVIEDDVYEYSLISNSNEKLLEIHKALRQSNDLTRLELRLI